MYIEKLCRHGTFSDYQAPNIIHSNFVSCMRAILSYLAKRMITVILNEISGRHALRPGGPDGRVLRPLWLPELVFLAR